MSKSNPYESLASYVSNSDNHWIPWDEASQSEIMICKLNPSTGEMVLLIKTPSGNTLSKHFHPGTVIVYTIQGKWSYNEGWVAGPGDVVYETAGSTHAPTMLDPETPTIVFAVIQGALSFVDENGSQIAYENWQTLLKLYHEHCKKMGIMPRDVTSF